MSDRPGGPETDAGGKGGEAPYPPERRAWSVVVILLVVYIFSFMDRQILSLLVKPIKADMGLSDLQMSYLMGISFAIFYALFGLPIGRMADSMSRKGLIGAGLLLWTVMTAGCGLANTYRQLLLLRIGVGVGEASLSPSAYSMITDYFPKSKLARALSVYAMGISIGSGMAYLVGGNIAAWAQRRGPLDLGLLGEIAPWQVAFLLIGGAGILPLVLLVFVREPERRGVKKITTGEGKEVEAKVPLPEVFAYMLKNWRTFLCHHVAFALLAFSGYGLAAWCPTLLMRIHGWDLGQVGTLLGLRAIVFTSAGIILGGTLSDWLSSKGYLDAPLRVGMLAAVLWMPVGIAYPLVTNGWACYALMNAAFFVGAFTTGLGPAALQRIMPNKMRGLSSAMFLLVVNLVGLGLGPTAVALFTVVVFQDDMKLGYSLAIVGAFAHLCSLALFYLGLRSYRASVERLDDWEAANT